MKRRRAHQEPISLFAFQDIIMCVTGVVILLSLLLVLDLIQHKTTDNRTRQSPVVDSITDSISRYDKEIHELRRTLSEGQEFSVNVASFSPLSLAQERTNLQSKEAALKVDLTQLSAEIQRRSLTIDAMRTESNRNAIAADLVRFKERIEKLLAELNRLKAGKRVVYNAAQNETKTAWLVDLSAHAIKVTKPGQPENALTFEIQSLGDGISEFVAWSRTRDPSKEYFVLLVRPKSLATYRKVYKHLEALDYRVGVDLLESNATIVDPSKFSTEP